MIPYKQKKLALLCAAPLIASQAFGLGVGNIEVSSQLGAPLAAEIPLNKLGQLDESQVRISLASRSDHERLGVESALFHQQLRFKPVVDRQSGRIRVTSELPVHEPFLNFVLSVEWPGGHLLREYILLLDPVPTLSALPVPVNAAPASRALPAATPTVSRRFESDTVIQPGDSLWRLARRMPRPAGTNLAQVMNALYSANPDAFVNGDPNRLKVLSPIKKPLAADIEQASRVFNARQASTATASDSKRPAVSAAIRPAGPAPMINSSQWRKPLSYSSGSSCIDSEPSPAALRIIGS